MDRRHSPVALREQAASPFRAGDDAHDALFELDLGDLLLARASGQQRRLIDQVGQVGTRQPGGLAGQRVELDLLGQRFPACMDLQDRVPPAAIRRLDGDLTVEAARPQQRRVEHVGPVRGRDDDHAISGLEAVHLDEQLVQRLLALVVAATHAGATVAADRVDLVDEQDRRRLGLRSLEQVAHARGADADEHLHEVRPRDREERHPRLTCDRARQQRLACPRRPMQEHALGDPRADGLEARGMRKELRDLAQFLHRLIGPGDIAKAGLRRVRSELPGGCATECAETAAGARRAAEHQQPQPKQQRDRQQHPQQHAAEAGAAGLDVEANVAGAQLLDQRGRVLVGIADRVRRTTGALDEHAVVAGTDDDLADVAALERDQELAERRLGLLLVRGDRGHEHKQPEHDRPGQHHLLQGPGHATSLAAAAAVDHRVGNAPECHGDRASPGGDERSTA